MTRYDSEDKETDPYKMFLTIVDDSIPGVTIYGDYRDDIGTPEWIEEYRRKYGYLS